VLHKQRQKVYIFNAINVSILCSFSSYTHRIHATMNRSSITFPTSCLLSHSRHHTLFIS
jgi:hypothetical protein